MEKKERGEGKTLCVLFIVQWADLDPKKGGCFAGSLLLVYPFCFLERAEHPEQWSQPHPQPFRRRIDRTAKNTAPANRSTRTAEITVPMGIPHTSSRPM